jgi:Rrf2 family iron-sulfur cluster assembly transcriptional regulator
LRALSHLARRSGDAVLGRDLARSVGIPANYLAKVLLTLRNAGLVDTTRGSGGGYRLRRPATEIHLIDVVELFDEVSRAKPGCFLGRTRPCSEAKPCTPHSTWKGLLAHLSPGVLKLLPNVAAWLPHPSRFSKGGHPDPSHLNT